MMVVTHLVVMFDSIMDGCNNEVQGPPTNCCRAVRVMGRIPGGREGMSDTADVVIKTDSC